MSKLDEITLGKIKQLANASSVSQETIKNIENGTFIGRDNTHIKLEQCFERNGIKFMGDNRGYIILYAPAVTKPEMGI